MTTTNLKQINWRAGRSAKIQEATAYIHGVGPARCGRRSIAVTIELANTTGNEHILVVTPTVAADRARVKAYGGQAYRKIQTVGRPLKEQLAGLLEELAADAERAWRAEGEQLPGCHRPVQVGVTAIVTQ